VGAVPLSSLSLGSISEMDLSRSSRTCYDVEFCYWEVLASRNRHRQDWYASLLFVLNFIFFSSSSARDRSMEWTRVNLLKVSTSPCYASSLEQGAIMILNAVTAFGTLVVMNGESIARTRCRQNWYASLFWLHRALSCETDVLKAPCLIGAWNERRKERSLKKYSSGTTVQWSLAQQENLEQRLHSILEVGFQQPELTLSSNLDNFFRHIWIFYLFQDLCAGYLNAVAASFLLQGPAMNRRDWFYNTHWSAGSQSDGTCCFDGIVSGQ